MYRATFNSIDTDRNGYISKEELSAFLDTSFEALHLEQVNRLQRPSIIFKQIDTNSDGNIDFDEFCAATCDRNKVLTDENLGKFFTMLDEDQDGKISRKDMEKMLKAAV